MHTLVDYTWGLEFRAEANFCRKKMRNSAKKTRNSAQMCSHIPQIFARNSKFLRKMNFDNFFCVQFLEMCTGFLTQGMRENAQFVAEQKIARNEFSIPMETVTKLNKIFLEH